MSSRIPQRELRNDNARIVDAVVAGATFVVTRNGEPVAEIRPVSQVRRTLVPKSEVLRVAGSGGRIDSAAFRADLDAAVDQDL